MEEYFTQRDTELGSIRRFVVEHMDIRFVDERRHVTWRMEGRDMSFSRANRGIRMRGTLEVFSGYGNWTAMLTSSPHVVQGERLILIEAQVRDVPLGDLARFVSFGESGEKLEARELKLEGYMSLSLSREGAPKTLIVQVDSPGGHMKIPYVMETFADVQDVKLDLLARVDRGLYELREFSYRQGEYVPRVHGHVLLSGQGARSVVGLDFEAQELFMGEISLYDSARLKARLEQQRQVLVIDELSARVGGGALAFTGRLNISDSQPSVRIQGTVQDVALSAVLSFWPWELLPTQIASLVRKVPKIFFKEANISVDMPKEVLRAYQNRTSFPENAIVIDARFQDGVYLSPPPIKILDDVHGVLTIRGPKRDVWIDSAQLRAGDEIAPTGSGGTLSRRAGWRGEL